MDKDSKRRLVRTLRNVSILLCIGLAYYILVKIAGFALPCVFNKVTGLYCPGCGITRMVLALASFDLAGAFRCNALVMIGAPIMFVFWLRHTVIYIKSGKEEALSKAEIVLIVAICAASAVFTLLRNLPGFEFLAPV